MNEPQSRGPAGVQQRYFGRISRP